MFIGLRERGRGREGERKRERERNIDWLLPMCTTMTREQTYSLGRYVPDWELNLQPFGVQGWCPNQLSHLARTTYFLNARHLTYIYFI